MSYALSIPFLKIFLGKIQIFCVLCENKTQYIENVARHTTKNRHKKNVIANFAWISAVLPRFSTAFCGRNGVADILRRSGRAFLKFSVEKCSTMADPDKKWKILFCLRRRAAAPAFRRNFRGKMFPDARTAFLFAFWLAVRRRSITSDTVRVLRI